MKRVADRGPCSAATRPNVAAATDSIGSMAHWHGIHELAMDGYEVPMALSQRQTFGRIPWLIVVAETLLIFPAGGLTAPPSLTFDVSLLNDFVS